MNLRALFMRVCLYLRMCAHCVCECMYMFIRHSHGTSIDAVKSAELLAALPASKLCLHNHLAFAYL